MKNFIFLFFILPLSLFSQIFWQNETTNDFKISIQSDRKTVDLGESFVVNLDVEYPNSYIFNSELALENLMWNLNPLIPQFELLESAKLLAVNEKNKKLEKFSFTLQPLKEGHLYFTFFDLNFYKSDHSVEIQTPPFLIKVFFPHVNENLPIQPLLPLVPEFPVIADFNNQKNLDDPNFLRLTTHHFKVHYLIPWMILLCFFIYNYRSKLIPLFLKKENQCSIEDLKVKWQKDLEKYELSNDNNLLKFEIIFYEFLNILLKKNVISFSRQQIQCEINQLALSEDSKIKLNSILEDLEKIKFGKVQINKDRIVNHLESLKKFSKII